GIWTLNKCSDRYVSHLCGSVFVSARGTENSSCEYHGGESLLQSTHSAAGALSAVGWVSAGRRSAGWRRATDERRARVERAFSESHFCRHSLTLLAGFPAERAPGRAAPRLERCGGDRESD